jgi:hypothetical protein
MSEPLERIKYDILSDMLIDMLSIEESFYTKHKDKPSVNYEIVKQSCRFNIDDNGKKSFVTSLSSLYKHTKNYGAKLHNRGLYHLNEEEIEIDIDKRINRAYNLNRLL